MRARLLIRVQPRARRPGLRDWLADGALGLAVAAPPVGGRANQEVAELVAGTLGLRARDVRVVRGSRSHTKLIEVEGVDDHELRSRLSAALQASKADHGE